MKNSKNLKKLLSNGIVKGVIISVFSGIILLAVTQSIFQDEEKQKMENSPCGTQISGSNNVVNCYLERIPDKINPDDKPIISKEIQSQIDENINQNKGKIPNDLKYLIKVGNYFYYIGKYQNATEAYDIILEQDPQNIFAIFNKAGALSELGQYEEALRYLQKSIEIDQELNDKVGLAKDYNNIGAVLSNTGNYTEALNYHKKSLEIDQELNDKVGLAKNYNNIGVVLSNTGKYSEALENFKKSLEIHQELNDKAEIALNYVGIGGVFFNNGK